MDTKEIYTELYSQNQARLNDESSEFLIKLRDDAIESFAAKGFPTKKDERYKYTSLESNFANSFKKHLEPKEVQFDVNEIFKCDVPSLDTNIVLLVNGFWYDRTNAMHTLERGILVGSLAEAIQKYPDLVACHLGKAADTTDPYVAINTAFVTDGLFMYVPKNKQFEKPLQIINVLISDEELMVQPRNLIICEDNSSAQVVVCDHTLSEQAFLTNSVTEIFLANGAKLDYFKVQNEHNQSSQVSHSFTNQQANSSFKFNCITLHGGLVRNNINIKLNGEGAEANASGIFVADNTQHIDNSIFIHHAKPNCNSNQLFKSILEDKSTGAFTGRILVDRDAQKTAAYQRNSNMLLTNEAKMNAKPVLEIYADDVKCSHGSTVGQLDDDAMFYLQARGIGKDEARLMLMSAFSYEVLNEINIEPLKVRMTDLIEKRLRGELSRCNNCAMNCG